MTTIRLNLREQQILTLIADGHTYAEICRQLHLSISAVQKGAVTAYDKLGARNAPHAVARGYQLGLLPLPTPGGVSS